MALDERLLDDANRTAARFLRLYRWDPPALSFGRNEPTLALYDRDAVERRGLAVVRRPTGGRAVWHEHELTYAVAAPIAVFGALRAAYLAIHERLAIALRGLGADATLAVRPSARPPVTAGACFASPVGGEILVRGRKLVGSAQLRRGGAFLQHGSILLDGSQEIVNAVSRQPSGVSGETTLSAALGRAVSFEELSAAITAAWGEALLPSDSPTVRPSDEGWVWRR